MSETTAELLDQANRLDGEALSLRQKAAHQEAVMNMRLVREFEARTGVEIGVSDDYAVLETFNGWKFYFGYEHTVPPSVYEGGEEDDDAEWAFVAWSHGNERIRLPVSQVHPEVNEEPLFYLLAGIGHMLSRGDLGE